MCIRDRIIDLSNVEALKNVIHYLKEETGNKFQSAIVLSDINYRETINHEIHDNILDYLHIQTYIYWMEISVHTEMPFNDTKKLEERLQIANSNLIFIYDFNIVIRSIFRKFSSKLLRENVFVIVINDEASFINLKLFLKEDVHFRKGNLGLDSQLYTIKINFSNVTLSEVYKPCPNHLTIVREILVLDKIEKNLNRKPAKWNRRRNLLGCKLRVAYVDAFPYITKLSDNKALHEYEKVFTSGGVTMVGGIINELDMINLLAMDLNFTVTWIESKDRSYGVYDRWSFSSSTPKSLESLHRSIAF